MKFKVFLRNVKLSVMEASAYRVTNIIMFFVSILFFVLEILSGFVFYNYTDTIMGLSKMDYFNLIITGNIIVSLNYCLFIIGIEKIKDDVLDGVMDYVFIKPINSFFYYSFIRIDIQNFFNLIMYIFFQIYLFNLQKISLLQILIYSSLVIISTWYVFLINMLMTIIVFYTDKANAVFNYIELFENIGKKPKNIYPKGLKMTFIYVLSYLLVYNLPIEALNGSINIYQLIYFIIITIIISILVYKMWYIAIKKYQSAN